MNELESFVLIDVDHPGALDQAYKARRNAIAEAANKYWREGGEGDLPLVDYSDEERDTWKKVSEILSDKLRANAFADYLVARDKMEIDWLEIPQMGKLSELIKKASGWQLAPVAGLVNSRGFLGKLAEGKMLCTQYIRHHSKPEFTPEPDIIHEYIGHVPTFLNDEIVDISRTIGRIALKANEEQLKQLELLYWFTLEFGLIEEKDKVKLFGAGTISSIGEQNKVFGGEVEWRPFELERVINEKYDFTAMQPYYYVVPSLAELKKAVVKFSDRI